MNFTLIEYLLYTLIVLSIGSYAAAFSFRWPIKQHYEWRKEAHQLLELPIDDKAFLEQTINNNPSFETQSKRSACPHCKQTLSWKDLIPLISFVLLKGKCRYCNTAISYRYSGIELLHIACCFPLLWYCQNIYQLILMTILISALIIAAVVDLEHKLIPDECNAIALGCALLSHIQFSHIQFNYILFNHVQLNTLNSSVLGMLLGYSALYLIRLIYFTLRHQEGLGLGDVKLLAVLGAWLGVMSLTSLLLCASISGILYTLIIKRKASTPLAFGPFLIFSGIALFYYFKL